MIIVSRQTFTADGQKVCSWCGRPRDRRGQRYCRRCHREYMRGWRAGKIETLLTPEEREAVLAARAAAAEGRPGRHRLVS